MSASFLLLAFVTLQRAGELVWARRNTRRLKARGGVEIASGHYPLIVAVHAAWLAGLWWLAWNRPVSPGWASVYAVLQVARFWILATLGERWTTRIIVLPDAPLVSAGPYRFVEWREGLDITFEANPRYWGPRPQIPGLVFRAQPEAASRVALLETGEADLITGVPPELIAYVREFADVKTARAMRRGAGRSTGTDARSCTTTAARASSTGCCSIRRPTRTGRNPYTPTACATR